MMKKILAMMLAATMVFTLGACGNNKGEKADDKAEEITGEAAGDTTEVSDDELKICHIKPAEDEFFTGLNDTFSAQCEEAGYTFSEACFEGDYEKLMSIVETLVQDGVDMILCNPLTNAGDDAFKYAMENGVTVLLYGNGGQYDYLYGTDEYSNGATIGTMAGEWAQEKHQGNVKVAFVVATYSESTVQRTNGMKDAFLELCPDAEVVGEGEYMNTGDATTVMEVLLQKDPDIQVVVAINDQSGIEAAEAMKAAGKNTEDYAVFSTDGTEEALKRVKNGDVLRGTVSYGDIGMNLWDVVNRILAGEVEKGVVTSGGITAVTEENIDEFYTE